MPTLQVDKPKKIMPVATVVTGDEKAMALLEVNSQSPGNRGMHRYQIIYVIRGDRVAEFRRDMGMAKKWRGVQYLNIPSYLEHSVDELMDIADYLRSERKIDLHEWLQLDNMKLA